MRFKQVLTITHFLSISAFFGLFFFTNEANAMLTDSSIVYETPQILQKDHQVLVSNIIKGSDIDLNKSIGSKVEIITHEIADPSKIYPFEIVERYDLPYLFINIYSGVSENTTFSMISLDNGKEFKTKAYVSNVVHLPEGKYEIKFENCTNEQITFEIFYAEYPFIGKVASIGPSDEFNSSVLENFIKDGGYIFSYGNESVLKNSNLKTENIELTENFAVEKGYPETLTKIQLLDMSQHGGLYIPLISFNSEYDEQNKYLAVYLPDENGGLIFISETIMSLNKDTLTTYLQDISSKIFYQKSELKEFTDVIKEYNELFILGIFVITLLIVWVIFGEKVKNYLDISSSKNLFFSLKRVITSSSENLSNKSKGSNKLLRFLLFLSIIFFVLGLIVIRMYQQRALPLTILTLLDSLNLWLDSVGFESSFTYILIFVMFVELLILVTISKKFINKIKMSDEFIKFTSWIGTKIKKYGVKNIENILKILIIIVGITIFTLQLSRYYGIYPNQFETEFEVNEIKNNVNRVGEDEAITEFANFVVEPEANYENAEILVDTNIESDSEVYISIANQTIENYLYYSPNFDMDFTGKLGNFRYYTYDKQNFEPNLLSNEELLSRIKKYNSLGIDLATISNSFIENFSGDGVNLNWGSFILDDIDSLVSSDNGKDFEYEFNDLVGQFEFYTILNDSVQMELKYSINNIDGDIPGLFIALIDSDSRISQIQIADDLFIPLGNSTEEILTIDEKDLEPGVYRIVVGYDPKSVLLDEKYDEVNQRISIRSITINSNKLVFRPISPTWAILNDQELYVQQNESGIYVRKFLKPGFNEIEVFDTDDDLVFKNKFETATISIDEGSMVSSFYTIYALDETSFFYPFDINITEVDKRSEIILSKEVNQISEVNMRNPISINIFTFNGQKFILSQPIAVKITKQ